MKGAFSISFIICIFCVAIIFAISAGNTIHHKLKPSVVYKSGIQLSSNNSNSIEAQHTLQNSNSKKQHHNATHIHLASWRWEEFGFSSPTKFLRARMVGINYPLQSCARSPDGADPK